MRTPALLSLVTLISLAGFQQTATAQIYSWKDASGKIHYSDKPPLDKKKAQTKEIKIAGPADPAVAPPGTPPANPAKEPVKNDPATGKSADQLKAEADARTSLCDTAQKRLKQLETTQGVLVKKNDQGMDVPLVGEERKAETENARKEVANWCK